MCVGKNVRNEGKREKENRRKGRRKRGVKAGLARFDDLVMQGTITVTPISVSCCFGVIPGTDRQGEINLIGLRPLTSIR